MSKKNTHKVEFTAKVPTPTPVSFKTKDGERVKFIATEEKPQKIQFWAKNEP